jgi:plastocyanin
MRTRHMAAGTAAALLLVGCSAGGTQTPAAQPEPAAAGEESPPDGGTGAAIDADVVVRNFLFVPGEVTIAQGQETTWENQDNTAHPLVFADGRRAELPGGSAATIIFDEAGVFTYGCGIHSSMTGTVTVLAADASVPDGARAGDPSGPADGSSNQGYGY